MVIKHVSEGTYRADIHDGTVNILDNLLPTSRLNSPVITEALQKIVLDVRNIDQVRDFSQESLSLLSTDIWREDRRVGPSATQVLDSAAKWKREGTLGEVVLYLGRLEEPFRLSVVFPKEIGVGEIISRLALQIRDDQRRVSLQQAIAPALLEVPVVKAGQEHLIRRLGDDPVCFILAFGNGGQLAINDSSVLGRKVVHSQDSLEDKIVALLPVKEEVFPGILM